MDLKVFEFLGAEVPNSVGDIREALDLLATSIDTAIEQVGEEVTKSFENKDLKKAAELSLNSEELDSISMKIQEVISDLDTIIYDRNIDEDLKEMDQIDEKSIPNYNDYLVDTEVEHNLYEDLTHKRPCAFKIEGTRVGIKDWKGVLVQTINYLAKSFVDDSKMNGKKVIYFSRVKLPTMRAVVEIKSVNIYVATKLSANGIRNLLIKMLNKYNIKLSDYKIYLKADYSELH